MARDMVNARMLDEKWKKQHTTCAAIRIQNSTGIPLALEAALRNSGKTKNAYIIEAIREKLIRDGYLQGGSEPK